MIGQWLLLFGCLGVVFVYCKVFFVLQKNKENSKISLNGLEIAKEITAQYDEINIVESKKIWMSQYDFRRNVIRLLPRHYEGTDSFSLALSAQLAGFSLESTERDQYFKLMQKCFWTIDWLNKSLLLATLVSCCTNTIGDAKIGGVLLLILLVYQYLRLQMNVNSSLLIEKNLREEIWKEVKGILEVFQFLDKGSFVITLLFLFREIVMILGF